MGKWAKLIRRILEGRSDANIAFSDLMGLLVHLGFEGRTRGSHHVFRRAGVDEKLNLQRDDGKAKPLSSSAGPRGDPEVSTGRT